jgi:OOP family OmpA-OmpF porin
VLDKIVEILKDNPELKIEIQGHTDDVGSAAYNKYLSEHRAKAVMEYFVQEGINPDRLSSTGYGSTKPKVPNDSAENRARNRRVELNPIQ